MSEASARAKWLFWGMAAASLLLAVIPSLVLIDKAREFHRFLTGWQPDTLRQLTIRRVPRHDAEDEKQARGWRFIEFSLRPESPEGAPRRRLQPLEFRPADDAQGGSGAWWSLPRAP